MLFNYQLGCFHGVAVGIAQIVDARSKSRHIDGGCAAVTFGKGGEHEGAHLVVDAYQAIIVDARKTHEPPCRVGIYVQTLRLAAYSSHSAIIIVDALKRRYRYFIVYTAIAFAHIQTKSIEL